MNLRLLTSCTLCAVLLGNTVLLSQEDETTAQDGEADLTAATELKLNATSVRDLDNIADLCESAIEKGLEGRSLEEAKNLWSSVLMDHAELLADRILEQVPRDRKWRFYRQQALERLDKAVELTPDRNEAYMLIARLNILEDGDRDAAEAAIEKVIDSGEGDPTEKSHALVIRAQLVDDDDKRLEFLNEALEVHPENAMALQLRGTYYLFKDDHDKAVDDFRKLSELQTGNASVLVVLAETLAANEKNEEALEFITKAIEINPDLFAAYTLRARLYMILERDEEAMGDITKALELNPRDLASLMMRANLYYDQKEYEKALEDVDKVLVFQPGTVQALYMRSFIFAALENYDSAIKDMKTLADFESGNLQWQNDLAMLYNAAERPRKAISIYDQILDREPKNQRALRGRGDARLSTGEHKEAIDDYEAALKIEPEDDGVLNNLAWVLATSPLAELRDGKRSIELSLKACELTEYGRAHILSTLASGYAEVGDFETAIEWSTKAVDSAEDDEQRENLSKELESYKKGEPWRERQTIEDDAPDHGGGELDVDKDKDDGGDDDGEKDKEGDGKKKDDDGS